MTDLYFRMNYKDDEANLVLDHIKNLRIKKITEFKIEKSPFSIEFLQEIPRFRISTKNIHINFTKKAIVLTISTKKFPFDSEEKSKEPSSISIEEINEAEKLLNVLFVGMLLKSKNQIFLDGTIRLSYELNKSLPINSVIQEKIIRELDEKFNDLNINGIEITFKDGNDKYSIQLTHHEDILNFFVKIKQEKINLDMGLNWIIDQSIEKILEIMKSL